MKAKNVVHSKIRNPGILFEMLVRQITVDTLEGNVNSPAMNIMRTYFRPTTELGKELQLYRAFFEMGRLTEVKATQFIDLITTQRKKLDEQKLAREKYDLIKEVRRHYDLKTFLSPKIPSYKVYASIYKTLISETHNFNVSNIQEIAMSRFTLIEHLIRDKKPKADPKNEADMVEVFKNQTEDLRLLTYKVLLEKFNQKYNNLDDKQKMLLREYINSVSDTSSFLDYVKKEIDPMRTELREFIGKERDKVMQIKLNEVFQQLEKIKGAKKIKDNELVAMLIGYEILRELRTV